VNKMFGKYQLSITTNLDTSSVIQEIELWSKENKLTEVKSVEGKKKFRYGSPFISNPIYIEIDSNSRPVLLEGWVQTLIPFLRWKLIRTENNNIGSKIDYRRKGGYFCFKLESKIANKAQ